MTTLQPARTAVRKAAPAEAAVVSSALAAAFEDDPVFRWMLPDETDRAARTRAFFDLVVEVLAVHDDAWTTTDGITGAALWVPYGQPPMSDERADRFLAEVAEICGRHADRTLELIAAMDESHPHAPHEYLWFVGVVPAAQGRGIGSALIAPVLERADRAGAPAYLEATSPLNKALYERHGFRARSPISVAGGPPMWPMWRDPA
jgi:GNAT superfamily N-acetyltransferase